MRTLDPATRSAPTRHRSRFGYSQDWWRESEPATDVAGSYWSSTRHPSLCLLYVLPLLLVYESGIRLIGGSQFDSLRAGIDSWVHHGLALLGITNSWIPPIALLGGMAFWLQKTSEEPVWRAEPLAGMTLESLSLAVCLIGLSKLVDLGLNHLEHSQVPLQLVQEGSAGLTVAGRYLSFLGAGIYEEAVFRLGLIPLLYAASRFLLLPGFMASTLAITGSSLLFSMAHHIGLPGESFTWYAFVFRWIAGVYFSWVFVARGFGIAVGTHVAYDCLVGCLTIPA